MAGGGVAWCHVGVEVADAEVTVQVGGLPGRSYWAAFAEALVGGGVDEHGAVVRLRRALPVGASVALSPQCAPGGYPQLAYEESPAIKRNTCGGARWAAV